MVVSTNINVKHINIIVKSYDYGKNIVRVTLYQKF